MREIKFRAKSLLDGNYVYGGYYHMPDCLKDETRHIIVTKDTGSGAQTRHEPIDIETLGEYTGLQDENGVEIYERDVVIFTDYITEEIVSQKKYICMVIKECGAFGIATDAEFRVDFGERCDHFISLWEILWADDDTDGITYGYLNSIEVIGNEQEALESSEVEK